MKLSFIASLCFSTLVLILIFSLIPLTSYAYSRNAQKSPSERNSVTHKVADKGGSLDRVTFYSVPSGALITTPDGSRQFGVAPVIVEYPGDPQHYRDGCHMVEGVKAQWISGATQMSANPIALCNGPTGKERTYTVNIPRPANAANSQKDIEFAIQYESQQKMQGTQMLQQIVTGLILQQSQPQSPQVNCTSYVDYAGNIQTRCN